jgi:hypothetical protein
MVFGRYVTPVADTMPPCHVAPDFLYRTFRQHAGAT